MRPAHCISPRSIYQQTRSVMLDCLGLRPFRKSVSVAQLVDLLLLMACHASSLFAMVRRFFPFSHQTANLAIHTQLPSQEELTQNLVDALFAIAEFSRHDRCREWQIAIDTHLVPYYGKPTPDVMGGLKKQGTNWFFGYATAVLLHRRRRYTIAIMAMPNGSKPHEIVRTLLDQIARKNVSIGCVTLDSAFDSGDTLLLLQERNLAYSIPLKRNGTGRNARNQWFDGRHRLVRWVSWKTEKTRRTVHTRTLLWKSKNKTMLFAFHGLNTDQAHNVHQRALELRDLYRRRFGIETSYRQKNQARAWTTSPEPIYRLLLEGIAQLLRQVWVFLTHAIARSTKASQKPWIGSLPLRTMLDWLARELESLNLEASEIPLT